MQEEDKKRKKDSTQKRQKRKKTPRLSGTTHKFPPPIIPYTKPFSSPHRYFLNGAIQYFSATYINVFWRVRPTGAFAESAFSTAACS
jgi:hypothetical protein